MNVVERVRQRQGGTRLVVRCLGRFRLEDGAGDQLQIRTRKARALLACLALSGRPMSREALADLLWSDRGPVQARSSVRQSLFELQHLDADPPILIAARDDVALRADAVATDLELIRSAAGDGDWPRLLALFEESEPGLLTDLDGLDREMDDWLRAARGSEPSKTLAAAVGAAERCLDEAGPRAAMDLLAEILRLDPANEEAVRLALRIDHQLGDSGALHRHFTMLRERLREDYDAEPSPETVALFRRLSGAAAPAGAEAKVDGGEADAPAAPARRRWPVAAAALAVLLIAAAALWALVARDDTQPGADAPILLAVLPFEQQPAGDSFLAEGLWDDTRTALSQNSGLRVLGRATTKAMAERDLDPAQYRRRLGVDYLLEASVRRSGEQVLVSASLTRTLDGVSIWEDSFRGQLGDPLALQVAVSRGIEGRLRGRLASGGGTRAEQIATSPEVYALYSEARVLLRARRSEDASRAGALLRRAVALDPNFAPAWASLAAAAHFSDPGPIRAAASRSEAIGHARHAIELAPNLAEAHANLALIAGSSSRLSEPSLERAVALDPGNADAWTWLGNVRSDQYRVAEAVAAYRRAIEIDPLLLPPIHNLVAVLVDLGRRGEAEAIIARLRQAGAEPTLVIGTQAHLWIAAGDYSAAARALTDFRRSTADRSISPVNFGLGEAFLHLGYADQAAKAWNKPGWYGPMMLGKGLPPGPIRGRAAARDFWSDSFLSFHASVAMVNLGRSGELIAVYRQAHSSPAEFIEASTEQGTLENLAPVLAVALRRSGEEAEAGRLLGAAAARLERLRPKAGENRDLLWRLARIRAAQGEGRTALRLMAGASARGWRPDGFWSPTDIAEDPAFAILRRDPRFQAIRSRFLAHIARERAELGPVTV